jgi:hypothetical protein
VASRREPDFLVPIDDATRLDLEQLCRDAPERPGRASA